jgi:hydantoinase/carbamoylase family amidase
MDSVRVSKHNHWILKHSKEEEEEMNKEASSTAMLDWLDKHLKKLNLVDTMDQEDGFNRLGYSSEEWAAMDVFCSICEELGLRVRRDEAGNCIARWDVSGEVATAVAVGSHLDTVNGGGGYDGVAGILTAFGAIKELKEEGFVPSYPLEVICFASEESSRFGVSTIGSKAMSGTLPVDELAQIQDDQGCTIQQAVEERGLSWSSITKAERQKEEIKSFIELHIEQGVRIEEAGADFGVVSAIACPIRLKITVQGKMGHTGTTPMGRRQDAFVAIAPLVSFISEEAEILSKENKYPIVATTSTVSLKPNSMTIIPSWIELGIDIRSVDDTLKQKMAALIQQKCAKLAEQYHVKIDIDTLVHNPSVALDQEVARKLKDLGHAINYRSLVMESGAGHDVMNMAKKWPSGLIFIPCRDGLSHHPQEFASLEDLRMGVKIIAAYMRDEAGE